MSHQATLSVSVNMPHFWVDGLPSVVPIGFNYDNPGCQRYRVLPTSQPLKPRRIGRRVFDGMLNIPVPQIVLNESRVGTLIGQGKAARVAAHMRMRRHGEAWHAGHSPGSPPRSSSD